jgi:hypothetical protein
MLKTDYVKSLYHDQALGRVLYTLLEKAKKMRFLTIVKSQCDIFIFYLVFY